MIQVVAVDPERMWAEDADVLTATLEPGFMLQGSASLSPDYLDADTPRYEAFEFKSEVLWGRAYFSELVLPEGGTQTFWLRGATDSDPQIHDPHALEKRRRWEWVREEGHLACVWRLAERVARAAGIDQMRSKLPAPLVDPSPSPSHDPPRWRGGAGTRPSTTATIRPSTPWPARTQPAALCVQPAALCVKPAASRVPGWTSLCPRATPMGAWSTRTASRRARTSGRTGCTPRGSACHSLPATCSCHLVAVALLLACFLLLAISDSPLACHQVRGAALGGGARARAVRDCGQREQHASAPDEIVGLNSRPHAQMIALRVSAQYCRGRYFRSTHTAPVGAVCCARAVAVVSCFVCLASHVPGADRGAGCLWVLILRGTSFGFFASFMWLVGVSKSDKKCFILSSVRTARCQNKCGCRWFSQSQTHVQSSPGRIRP